MENSKLQHICHSKELAKMIYLIRHIKYKQVKHTAIIFQFKDKAYAYVNHCMHMQRPLDCEEDTIFDGTGNLLRCSMHGFVFDPTNGECLSPVCAGQKLQTLNIVLIDENIYFSDKHVKLM